MIEFACPDCGEMLTAPDSLAGEFQQCPVCSSLVAVPQAGDGGDALPPTSAQDAAEG